MSRMLSAVMTPAKKGDISWTGTFPGEQETLAGSTLFMKRLLYVFFSQIMVHRELLPSHCFKKRRCDNLRLYVFNNMISEAFECADQLKSVCETIDLGYLRELHLNIMDGNGKEDEIIEVYKMGVSYGDDQSAPSVTIENNEMSRVEIAYQGKDALREQTRDLLLRLYQITAKLGDLPKSVEWKFYILYNDEKTPKGYQARLFTRRPEPYSINPDVQRLVIGDLSANHHACHFEVSSVCIDDAVEFEERVSGNFSSIENSFVASSRESSIQCTSPIKQSDLVAAAGLSHLEKEAEKMNMDEKDKGIASSPEDRNYKSPTPKRSSVDKVLAASKAIKRTPGDGTGNAKKKRRE